MFTGTIRGFGAVTTGAGPGAPTVAVTNLNNSGAGSLRAFLETPGPAVLDLQVSGDIDLNDQQIEALGNKTCDIRNSGHYLRLLNGRLRVIGNDFIWRGFQHIPVTPTDTRNIQNRDGISIGKDGFTVRRVIVDSNYIGFSGDEAVAVWGDVADVTISHNVISQTFRDVGHPDLNSAGENFHAMGILFGGPPGFPPTRCTLFGNLIQSMEYRAPSVQDGSNGIEVTSNAIDNPGVRAINCQGAVTAIVEQNSVTTGADSSSGDRFFHIPQAAASVFHAGNLQNGNELVPTGAAGGVVTSAPFARSDVIAIPAADVRAYVLANAGPNLTAGADLAERALDQYDKGTSRFAVTTADFPGLDYEFAAGTTPTPVTKRTFSVPGASFTDFFVPGAEVSHSIRLIAINRAGPSLPSTAVTATPQAAPTPPGTDDPEEGLSLTGSFAIGSSPAAGIDVYPDENAVFAIDFTGLNGAAGGLIYEQGGTGDGFYVGFNASGHFIVRAGDGGSATGASDHAYLIMTTGQPSGTGTLVVTVTPGTNAVAAYWYVSGTDTRTVLGTPVARASGTGNWANNGTSTYLATATASGVAGGELNTPVAYTTASPLRYYRDQTVS